MQIDPRYTFIGHIRLAEVARVGALDDAAIGP
jgi:hypothetical protein